MTKIYSLFLLLVVFGAVSITGCKKNGNGLPAGLSAKVNNNSWVAATYSAVVDTFYPGFLMIPELHITGYVGTPNTSPYIQLIIINYAGKTGTYQISDTSKAIAYYADSLNGSIYNAISGNLVLTSASSKNVQGNFSFVTDSITVTSGEFNINIP